MAALAAGLDGFELVEAQGDDVIGVREVEGEMALISFRRNGFAGLQCNSRITMRSWHLAGEGRGCKGTTR